MSYRGDALFVTQFYPVMPVSVAYDSLLSVTLLLSTSCAMLMAGVFMESRADNALCTCLVLPMSVLIVALIYAGE